MFRTARWGGDKSKIKAVFKLQFHATQVPQLWADALMVSVVPGDNGKPTVKLEKAVIRDGVCRWNSPVFETVKFTRDQKTGKVHEKIYYFILSTGSGKSAIVGEVSLDFADYAEATKACSVSLPINGLDTKALLNILIQRLQDTADQREVVENEDVKVKVQDRSLRSQFSNSSREDSISSTSIEDVQPLNQTVRDVVANGNYSASSGSDLTTSSENSSGVNTPREKTTSSNNIIQRDPNGFLNSVPLPHEPVSDGAIVVYGEIPKSQSDWKRGSCQDIEVSNEAIPGSETDELRSKLSSLVRQLNLSELELQTLQKQIVKESRRTHKLSREVVTLKEERVSLAEENKQLRAINERFQVMEEKMSKLQFEGGDLQEIIEECRQELDYEKNCNFDLRQQLQKTYESNTELILAVRDLEEMLDQKNKKISDLCIKLGTPDGEDKEQRVLEAIVKGQTDPKETYLLEQKILDLNGEIEIYQRDRDELEIQMEQLALDYEILKQKHHEISYKWEQSQLQEQLKLQYEYCSWESEKEYESKVERLEGELQMRSEELADSLVTIDELESKIKGLERERMRSEEFSDSLATIGELESNIKKLESELEKSSEEFSNSLVTISELESKVDRLQSELQIRSEELSDSLVFVSNLNSKVERLESELQRRSNELSDSFAAVTKLESKMKGLEGELKKRSKELSDSLATIRELETQVKVLEEELESRAQEFQNSLGFVTRAKVEQEKRAISAEEALQKMRWKNIDTANRLQEEFKKLSIQMASSFESNERVASKAVKEAAELRKSNEELQMMKDEYEAKVGGISREFRDMAKKLETEMTRLSTENNVLSTRAAEAELALQNGNAEKSKLESSITLLKMELGEKDAKVRNLELGLETLRVQCDELKGFLLEGKEKKEKLSKKLDLHSSNFGKNPSQKAANCSEGCSSEHVQPHEIGKSAGNRQSQLEDLSTELTLLKETNESMDIELKEMQEKYSELSLRFAEVEGQRQKLMMTVRYLKNARKK